MRKSLGAITVALGLLVSLTSAFSATRHFSYLIDAANKIADINNSKPMLSSDDNVQIATIACKALTRLRGDPDFEEALKVMLSPDRSPATREAASDLVYDINKFNSEFLPAEEQSLKAMGLGYPAIFDALVIAARERTRTRKPAKEISPFDVLDGIEVAKTETCKLARTIVDDKQRGWIMWGICGAVIIVADVVVAVAIATPSVGVGATAALTSTVIGYSALYDGAMGAIP